MLDLLDTDINVGGFGHCLFEGSNRLPLRLRIESTQVKRPKMAHLCRDCGTKRVHEDNAVHVLGEGASVKQTDQSPERVADENIWPRHLSRGQQGLVDGQFLDRSNGIHLNVIEASADPAAESWRNINAID